jgi:hypothetical protein
MKNQLAHIQELIKIKNMKIDYLAVVWIAFIALFLIRALIVSNIVLKQIPISGHEERNRMIFFIYGISVKKEYERRVKIYIRLVNIISKLIVLLILLAFILLMIENFIRDFN